MVGRNEVSAFRLKQPKQAKELKPPKALELLLRDPPLIGGELLEDYLEFFSAIAATVQPADLIDWMLLKDFADVSWEIVRERRIKADIIKLKRKQASNGFMSGIAISRAAFLAHQRLQAENSEAAERVSHARQPAPESGEILALAFIDGAFDIDAIDRRIAAYEWRRNNVLREIDRRSERLAQALRQDTDMIDANFTKAVE